MHYHHRFGRIQMKPQQDLIRKSPFGVLFTDQYILAAGDVFIRLSNLENRLAAGNTSIGKSFIGVLILYLLP